MIRLCCFAICIFSSASACEQNWTQFQGSCYKLSPYPIELNGSILESRWECLRLGADLAAIRTEEEQAFVESLLTTGNPLVTYGVYIAAGDGYSEGIMKWFDHSLVGSGKKWRRGNPNNDGPGDLEKNCVRVKSGYKIRTQEYITDHIGLWVSIPCLEPLVRIDSFLCQKAQTPKSFSGGHPFHVLKQHYFSGHHIGKYTLFRHVDCLTLCLEHYNCLSANYAESGVVSDNCILNNATLWEDRDVMLTNVTADVDPGDWDYYEVIYPAFRA